MDSSGLDDLWVESGLFAANSTETMMEGKAYYRVVRAHIWTFDALYRIKWKQFKEWATQKRVNLTIEDETLCYIEEVFCKSQIPHIQSRCI